MSFSNVPIGRIKWEVCPACKRKGWYWIRQAESILHLCKYCKYTTYERRKEQ